MQQQAFGIFDDEETKPLAVAQPAPKPITEEKKQFIVFEIENESYCIPLDSAREIIEEPQAKAVPNTRDYFVGYFNLRGEIVGLIDMRQKFALREPYLQPRSVIVFNCPNGTMAALVDNIREIRAFRASEIEPQPKVKSKIAKSHLLGMSRNPDYPALFVDLKQMLAEDDWVRVKQFAKTK